MKRHLALMCSILLLCAALAFAAGKENETKKHASRLGNVPAPASARLNPYEGKPEAVKAGRKLLSGIAPNATERTPAVAEKRLPSILDWWNKRRPATCIGSSPTATCERECRRGRVCRTHNAGKS